MTPKTKEIVVLRVTREIMYDSPEAKEAAVKAAMESVAHCQVTGAIGCVGAYSVKAHEVELIAQIKVG
jgi:hypothetical protein